MICSPINWRRACELWKKNRCQKLSCLMINVVIFLLFMCWELHITWAFVFSANPSTYVELTTFYTSEWLRTFNFVISLFFYLRRKRNCSTEVVQNNNHDIQYCVDKEHDVAPVIQCSQHEPSTLLSFICQRSLLQVFRVVKKQCGLVVKWERKPTICNS